MKDIPIGTKVLIIEPGRDYNKHGVTITEQETIECSGCGGIHTIQGVAMDNDADAFETMHLIPIEDPDADLTIKTKEALEA